MKLTLALSLALVVGCASAAVAPAPSSPIGDDIAVLASAALGGRATGSAGADSAAELIAQRYRHLELRPAFHVPCRSTPACPESYFQSFSIETGVLRNVAAIVDGSDPLVRDQFVVLGAHYDHLGRSPTFALDRDRGFILRPGADDNASGTAALLELARRFHDRPARRSILIVNFDAEEIGLVGSRVFLSDPPVPRAALTFMVNLDMIGRLRDDHLFVEGARNRGTRALIDSAAATARLSADHRGNEGRSDHDSFLRDGLDAISLSTGYHGDYHTASDIPSRINIDGIERVVAVAEYIVRHVADRD